MTDLILVALEIARLLTSNQVDEAERKTKALAQALAIKRATRIAAGGE